MSATQQEEDRNPSEQSTARINVKIKAQDGNVVNFNIKRSNKLKKLMEVYCDRQSMEFNSIVFLFDGRRLRPEQTPDEVGMEDWEEIDTMIHQMSG